MLVFDYVVFASEPRRSYELRAAGRRALVEEVERERRLQDLPAIWPSQGQAHATRPEMSL